MPIELVDIPKLSIPIHSRWQVKALVINGRDPARAALVDWKRKHPTDYEAIIKVLKFAASVYRVNNPQHVKQTENQKHGDVYEAIAYTGIACLMFFYDETANLIICTNEYEKGRGDHDLAFRRCASLHDYYLDNR